MLPDWDEFCHISPSCAHSEHLQLSLCQGQVEVSKPAVDFERSVWGTVHPPTQWPTSWVHITAQDLNGHFVAFNHYILVTLMWLTSWKPLASHVFITCLSNSLQHEDATCETLCDIPPCLGRSFECTTSSWPMLLSISATTAQRSWGLKMVIAMALEHKGSTTVPVIDQLVATIGAIWHNLCLHPIGNACHGPGLEYNRMCIDFYTLLSSTSQDSAIQGQCAAGKEWTLATLVII